MKKIINKILFSPQLSFAIFSGIVTLFFFISAYTSRSWRPFHPAMLTALLSAFFFASHYNYTESVGKWLAKEWRVVWLIASAFCLITALMHNWKWYIQSISTLCAILTVFGGWAWLGELAAKTATFLLNMSIGKRGGMWALLLDGAIIFAVGYLIADNKDYNLGLLVETGGAAMVIFGIAFEPLKAAKKHIDKT